ncbi:MAG: hypothetical protein A3H95_16855 [Acidobacteria bacterium RIFCSPLOWO2_02_FULL_64_15]|nr:MAG: hypothetical protein A3H95_16855 [Acidobacteria bacterium RIFCSPLOWO2_02_FULL_64_15]
MRLKVMEHFSRSNPPGLHALRTGAQRVPRQQDESQRLPLRGLIQGGASLPIRAERTCRVDLLSVPRAPAARRHWIATAEDEAGASHRASLRSVQL